MSKQREDLINTAARAACMSRFRRAYPEAHEDELWSFARIDLPLYIGDIEAALSAIEEAGYVVVPKADMALVTQGLVFDLLPASINAAINAYSPKPSGVEAPPTTEEEGA